MIFFLKKRTIQIFLCGGFGNNLFQISLGLYYKKNGYNVIYNVALLERNIFTNILGWNVHDSRNTKKLLSLEKVNTSICFFDVVYLVFSFIYSKLNPDFIKVFCPKKNFFNRKYGYWQKGPHLSEDVFIQLSKMMVEHDFFSYENNFYARSFDAVIHVRRGDFSSNRTLDFEFYKRAIKMLDISNAFLVTDDSSIKEKLSIFLDIPLYCNEGASFKDDFLMMANAKCLIMSNSTFCYWASQIGNTPLVIHPDKLEANVSWSFKLTNEVVIPVLSGFK